VHVETRAGVDLPADDLDRGIFYVRTRLGLEHVYASSAIPVLFPPVALHHEGPDPSWAIDGGVRLNVPLKPALDLGADRLVVVSTDVTARPLSANDGGVPTTVDVLDQFLHLATGDRLLEDLRTLTQVNQLVATGGNARTEEGRPFRKVPALVVAPEAAIDLANLVVDALNATPLRVLAPAVRLLSRVTGLPGASVPDLATFLLFLPAFTRRAVDLGRRRAQHALEQPGGGWGVQPADQLPPGSSSIAPAQVRRGRSLRTVGSG
jgi:NTE family protein